ncbi:amidohydrolase family protein [Pseudohongiella spirulinae]|uniref:Amidohydrolase n=1 Tax=Pseudohongiella spirulinae TaxID=1249552 RepID=A0A0S2KAW3_9GAMM|nr:amidohydrolase family protein [Pseudohongiella spirulinae]ALO45463.1 amidohydrolase [Pseudohongiella spirulinae]
MSATDSTLQPGSNDWLAQVQEAILEPERRIIDPHHHLWRKRLGHDYMLEHLWQDTDSGHRIEQTVFIECRAFYDKEASPERQSLGETRAITEIARQSHQQPDKAQINGIVGKIDLTLGEHPDLLKEIIQAHQETAGDLFKGVRFAGARDSRPEDLLIALQALPYLYGRENFRQGLRILGELGLTYDTWHYHHQNVDFCDLAETVTDTTLILDHFGTPLGVGIYRGAGDAIFEQWKDDIRRLSRCPNVIAKLGGLAMPDNGFGWDKRATPPDSDEIVRRQKKYYLHTIECFGPERCMFESNFPVDRLSVSYPVIWNAFKKMVADFSETEKHALFYGTAARTYGLPQS